MSSVGQQHAVFDSNPPELYGSVGGDCRQRCDESVGGGGILSREEKLVIPWENGNDDSDSESEAANSTYTALRDDREPSNEYDYIPGEERVTLSVSLPPSTAVSPLSSEGRVLGQQRRDYRNVPVPGSVQPNGDGGGGGGGGLGERKVTQNSMYENHDIKPLLHPTLTRAPDKYPGGEGGVGRGEGEEEEEEDDSLCTWSTRCIALAFFLALGVLLSLASIGLSVLMMYQFNEDPSAPTPTTETLISFTTVPPPTCDCPAKVSLATRRAEVEELKRMIDDYSTTVHQAMSALSVIDGSQETLIDEIKTEFDDIATEVYSVPPILNVSNVSHFTTNCTTITPVSCNVSQTDTSCSTDFINITIPDSSYKTYTSCQYFLPVFLVGSSNSATLHTREDGAMSCSCSVIADAMPLSLTCQMVVHYCQRQWSWGVWPYVM